MKVDSLGPSLTEVKALAEASIDAWFAAYGRPAGLAIEDAVTLSQAQCVLAGLPPLPEFEAEASERGITPEALAQLVRDQAQAAYQRKLRRIRAKLAVREASSQQEILAVLRMLDTRSGPT